MVLQYPGSVAECHLLPECVGAVLTALYLPRSVAGSPATAFLVPFINRQFS